MHRQVSFGALGLLLGTLCPLSIGCQVVDTLGDTRVAPTPAPTPYSSETLAAGLRAASLKLRGVLPSGSEITEVRAGGKPVYDARIDEWLDPAQNAELIPQLKVFYRKMFLMGGVISDDVDAPDPDPYSASNTNYDLPSDLAAWLFVNGKPVTELVTSDACIGDDLSQLPEAVAQVACEGAPKNAAQGNHRAGVIGMRPFLRKYGQANTLNLRRTSLVHQIFACEIYPDTQDPYPLARTNDVTHESTDNSDAALGSMNWPINDNLTPSILDDDFADPQLGNFANDPSMPERISKKYQSAKGGIACGSCHGKLNLRRTIFTPYTPQGIWSDTRSMANTRDPVSGSVDDNVESPAQINGKDYCGALGDTEPDVDGNFGAGNGNALDDDIDPGAFECKENGRGPARYHGVEARTLREYAALLVDENLTGGRFQTCMTTRHMNFVLGRSQGVLGMGANGGSGPTPLPAQTREKFETVYRSVNWDTRELVRRALKSSEFLSTQQ